MRRVNLDPTDLARLTEFREAYKAYCTRQGIEDPGAFTCDARAVRVCASYASILLEEANKVGTDVSDLLALARRKAQRRSRRNSRPRSAMQFNLDIRCDGVAFQGDRKKEIARILRVAAEMLEQDLPLGMALRDATDNRVGYCSLTAGEPPEEKGARQ